MTHKRLCSPWKLIPLVFILTAAGLVFPCRAAVENRVLDLDGKGGYVRLPDDIFTNLTAATIEARVFWRRRSSGGDDSQRFFSFGELLRDMGAGQEPNNCLHFFISLTGTTRGDNSLRTPPILALERWYHFAAVTGPQGVTVYLDGVPVLSSGLTNSLSSVSGKRNLLGSYNNWPEGGIHPSTLNGMIDEFRVWNRARTGEEIRGSMNQKLRGSEPGLVGLWNFDDGTAKDSSANRWDGAFVGSARTAMAQVPEVSSNRLDIGVLRGKLLANDGSVAGVAVSLESGSKVLVTGATDASGRYSLSYPASGTNMELVAVSEELTARISVHLLPGEQKLPDLLLQRCVISGSVTALNGAPQDSVVVEALWYGEGGSLVTAPAAETKDGRLSPGLLGEYFSFQAPLGSFPTFQGMKPSLTRVDRTLSFPNNSAFSPFGLSDSFCARWTGKLRVKKPGKYRLRIAADDGARIYLDKNLIYERTDWRNAGTVEVDLTAGDHDFGAVFVQNDGGCHFGVQWETEDGRWEIIPGDALFHSYSAEVDTAMAPLEPRFLQPMQTNRVLTGADGGFRITGLAPGWHQVRVFDGAQYCYFQDEPQKVFKVRAGTPSPRIHLSLPPVRKGSWRNFTYADGLSDDRVFCILADPEGYLWFGTGDGVSRFDGRQFVNLTKEDGLSHSQVNAICRGRDGTLWLGTERGASCYRGGKFVPFPFEKELADQSLRSVLEDADGGLWFGTWGNGAFLLRGETLRHFTRIEGLDPYVFAITSGPDRKVWVECASGISRFTGTSFTNVIPGSSLGGELAGALEFDSKGNLWIGTQSSGALWNYDGATVQSMGSLPHLGITHPGAMSMDADGSVWFGCRNNQDALGLACYRRGHLVVFPSPGGSRAAEIHAVVRDSRGALWVATDGSGVWRWDEANVVNFDGADGLLATNMFASVRNGADLWFGGDGGAVRWRDGRWDSHGGTDGLTASIATLTPFNHGLMLFGTRWGGAVVFDGTNFSQLKVPEQVSRELFAKSRVTWSAAAPDGGVWLGNFQNLFHYAKGQLETKRPHDFGFTNQFAIRAVQVDSTGALWIGSVTEGLIRSASGTNIHWKVEDGLVDNAITALAGDPDGSMWIGTENGLSHFNGREFVNYTHARERLAANWINCIYRDPSGAHWFGTRRGVTRFDGAVWTTLDARDGLAGNEVRGVCEDGEGNFWFATDRGVTRYRPQKVAIRAPTLTAVGDREYTDFSARIRLVTGRRLAFHFNAIDTRTGGKNRWYQHLVAPGALGVAELIERDNWQPPGRDTQIDWNPERSGTYTFAVRYIDRDANVSDPVFAFVDVVPPWYFNPFIAVPSGAAAAGLIGWAFIARMLFMRKRREAERLREECLIQEHKAREAAERARAEIELKNAELAGAKAAAEQASQAKSQFLANMSHELRTPLTAIIGFSEMLISEAEAEQRSEQIEDLTRINDSANHLLGLINGILDLSKIEAQKMELHLEDFDVAKLVQEVAEMMRSLVDKKGNRLELECPPDLGAMHADAVKVRQALLNLVGNANKFTEQGTLKLGVTRPTRDRVRFTVADSGIGMSEAQMARLFQPFTQADAATARKYGGSGLGLTITKRFCEMMGGTISVKSEPGRGSTFTMDLPVRVGLPKPAAPHSSAESVPAKNGKCVLVIDDDPNVHRLIERTLKDEPVSLRFAASAEEGLRLARESHPAVITLDVMMPETDGWSVLSTLKSDPLLAKIPVVMLSILSEKELGFALGAADYLVKPIDRNQLVLTLKKHLDGDPGRVLIVEDDPTLREMMRRMLEGEKWPVEDAANGAIALERIRAEAPAIILLDLMMPVMDGFQLLAELHKNESWRKIPVVVITAMDLNQADRAKLHQQTEKIFEKGAQLQEELLREVRSCLERYRSP